MSRSDGPLPVTISVPPALLSAVSSSTARAVEESLQSLGRDLRIQRSCRVTFVEEEQSLPRASIGVRVDGRSCGFPAITVAEVLGYVRGTPSVVLDPDEATLLAQLGELDDGLSQFLALVSRRAVSLQPGVLAPDCPMRQLLDLGIPRSADEQRADEHSADGEWLEDLIAREASESLTIIAHPDFFQRLTAQENAPDLLPFLRDSLFVELGLVLPRVHVQLDPALRTDGFTFRINGLTMLPRIGLPAGTLLVNDTADRLATMGLHAQPAANPGTGQAAAVVLGDHRQRLEAAGLTVWDPFGHLILAFATEIRRHAHWLMTVASAGDALNSLRRAFPEPVRALREFSTEAAFTRILRELLHDEVSVRNLLRIIELHLRHEIEADDGVPDEVDAVRAGLAHQIGHKVARGTQTIVAYLLAPALEQQLLGHENASSVPPADWLRSEVRTRVADLPPTAAVPAVLTTSTVRRVVRDALWGEFPQISVIGYHEVPPHFQVQPVARLDGAG